MRPTTSTSTRATEPAKKKKTQSANQKQQTAKELNKKIKQKQMLKTKLKKATVKFEKACKQLIFLDRKINDLHNLYTSSMETDRKTFKIVNRMQLATLEATHEAYIEYIERKVDEIRKLKAKIFGCQIADNVTGQ
jgi:hypothetical protein